jgi:hypothetical protein
LKLANENADLTKPLTTKPSTIQTFGISAILSNNATRNPLRGYYEIRQLVNVFLWLCIFKVIFMVTE